jgi:Methyltransferase domain
MSIRSQYEKMGVQRFYEECGEQYRNPHEPAVSRTIIAAVDRWSPDLANVLDLACGSGEVTLTLRSMGACSIHGIDPFTADAYRKRTGGTAEAIDFDAIAAGHLSTRHYTLIVCSYALHLVELSRLPMLAHALAEVGDRLLVVTPHKRPVLKDEWGWSLRSELVVERVRARYYDSRVSTQTGIGFTSC